MNYLSVCSGIEAATCAWHPLGWRPVAFSEIEKFPSAVLAHHYPDVPNFGDMTKYQEWPDADVDVLVGGTPCQSFSVAGLRKGLADPRGNLMLTFGAIAAKYRPEWLVWENVPGVLSSNGGRDFGTFLGMLGELGYGFAYRVLDAQYFGCAAARERVFVVAHCGNWRRAAAVLFERQAMEKSRPPRAEIRPVYYSHDYNQDRIYSADGIAPACTAQDSNRSRFMLFNGLIRRATPLEWERSLGFPDDYTDTTKESPFAGGKAALEFVIPLRDDAGATRRDAGEAGREMRSVRRRHGEASGGSLPSDGSCSRNPLPPLQHQAAGRRGHGLGDVGVGISGGRRVADGPRYKALGNSMAVPCMAWIGRRIDAVRAIAAPPGREAA